MKKLEVEYKKGFEPVDNNIKVGRVLIMITPDINEDYWIMRVKLYKDQAIVAFPKFGLIGVGFAQESDWNTNLPYQTPTEILYQHIKRNKKYRAISKATCIEALKLLQEACKNYEEVQAQKKPIVLDMQEIERAMARALPYRRTRRMSYYRN
jgi:hypothetical protein